MKRMFKNLAIAFTLILVTIPSFGWGRREHSTIAYIAESHLTPKAKKAISEILEGKSIVYYASWLDDYRKQMLIEDENSKGEIKLRTIPHGIKIDENGNPIQDDQAVEFPDGGVAKPVTDEDAQKALDAIRAEKEARAQEEAAQE